MKKVKSILYFSIVFFVLFSCSKDEEINEQVDDSFLINKEFLFNEKWYINSIKTDKITTFTGLDSGTNTLIQNEECTYDDYIIFKNEYAFTGNEAPNDVLLYNVSDNDISCWYLAEGSEYKEAEYRGTYDIDDRSMNIISNDNGNILSMQFSSSGFHWLFNSNIVSGFQNVKGYIENNGSIKKWVGTRNIFYGNESINLTFEMIAFKYDRP